MSFFGIRPIRLHLLNSRWFLCVLYFIPRPFLYIHHCIYRPTRGYKEMERTPRAARSLRNTLNLKTLPSPYNTQKVIEIRIHYMGTVHDTVRWSKVQNDYDSVFGEKNVRKKILSVLKEGECRCVPLAEHIKLIQKTYFIIKTILVVNVTYFNPYVSSSGGKI